MSLRPEDLLAGPRGRRFLLELASAADEALVTPISRFGYTLDPGAGTSRILMTFGDRAAFGHAAHEEPPTPSVAEVAALVRQVDPARIDAEAMAHALYRSVDLAAYWQPPYGEDELAALLASEGAFDDIAALAASRALPWWSQPRRTEQWAIEWHDPHAPRPLETDPRAAVSAWAEETRAEEARSAHERSADPHANWSGTWWSFPHGVPVTTGVDEAGRPSGLTLVEDSLGWEAAIAIPMRGAGRTFEVRSADDWADLCRRHPLEVTASRRHDWFRATGRVGAWVIPDWSLVADEFDAVHLPVEAYLTLAGRALAVDDDRASVIAGWQPDGTYWLTDYVREWEGGSVTWRRDDEEWMPLPPA